jgi:SAM-dependent methyltransferase
MRDCPGCVHRSAGLAGKSNGFRLVRCARCGTLFTETLPTPEQAMDYGSYYHEWNLRIPRCVQDRRDTLVERFARHRWLDVGCGGGTLMRADGSRGWVPVGTEVAPTAADAVRREGFEVHLQMLEDAPFADASFDVVSIVEVVEHVADADSLIRSARQVLRPGGALYLTTPHGRGLSARTLGLGHFSVRPAGTSRFAAVGTLRSAPTRRYALAGSGSSDVAAVCGATSTERPAKSRWSTLPSVRVKTGRNPCARRGAAVDGRIRTRQTAESLAMAYLAQLTPPRDPGRIDLLGTAYEFQLPMTHSTRCSARPSLSIWRNLLKC